MVEHIADWAIHVMQVLHYPGLMLMMALESMVAPVPSEVVMPFAGFLVVEGVFTVPWVIVVSSLGTVIGSLIGYYMGKVSGYVLVNRFGHLLLVDREHMDMTVKWFEKHGDITVFVCRFIPVIRHLSSIPAGAGDMNLVKFSIYTLLGGTIWNTSLLWAGIKLKDNWGIIHKYSHEIDYVVLVMMVVVAGWWVYKQWQRSKRKAA